MRIKRAEITGFGKYHERIFDFEAGNQLLFGNNEVGKSTLYQFLLTMLFGFPKKSRKKDYTPKNGAAFGGRLWLESELYGEVMIERYRQVNRGKAKVRLNDQTGDDALLKQLLQPLDQELFQEVFTFQQEQLTQLEKLQEGELHAALVALGISGSQKMLEKAHEFTGQNQQLFKPRGQKLPLNQALKRWDRLQSVISEKENEEASLQQRYQKIAELRKQQKALEEQLRDQNENYQKLQQQISHWSLYEEWQKLNKQKTEIASHEKKQQLAHFYQRYQQCVDEIRQKEDELSRLEQGQVSDKYFFFLDQEHQINQIFQQQVAIIRLSDELAEKKKQKEQLIRHLNELTRKWQWSKNNPPIVTTKLAEQVRQLEQSNSTAAESDKRQSWLSEKKMALEKELNHLEQSYPFLTKKQQRSYLPLVLAVGAVFIAAGLLMSTPLRWALLLAGGLFFSAGGILAFKSTRSKQQQIQIQWQEKLLQLDVLTNERMDLTKIQQQESANKQRIIQAIQPFFGTIPLEQWSEYLTDYQSAVEKYQLQLQELKTLDTQLKDLQETAAEYDKLFEPFGHWLPLTNRSLLDKLNLLQQFNEEMQEIKLTRLQQPSTIIAQQLKRKKEERDQLFKENRQLLSTLKIEHPAEISLWLKQWEQSQKMQQRKTELEQILTPIFPSSITQAEISEQKFSIEQLQRNLQQEIRQYTESRQRLELEVASSQKNGTLNQLYQEESDLRALIQEMAVTWGSNQLSAAFLHDLTTELSEQQLPHLLKQASYYFRLLSEDAYQEVTIDEGILAVKNQTSEFPIFALSTGTKDQLIMAIRFGYLSLQQERVLSPIIIDDGWLHYDSRRKQKLAQLLAEFGKKYQIICLSSDQEMVSYYQKYHQSVQEISERM